MKKISLPNIKVLCHNWSFKNRLRLRGTILKQMMDVEPGDGQ